MDKTLIFKVVKKSNVLGQDAYVVASCKEDVSSEYLILKEIEITPSLDEEGIKKFIEKLKESDHEKRLKELYEVAYGMPYSEEHRKVAEELYSKRSEPSDQMKRIAAKAFGIENE